MTDLTQRFFEVYETRARLHRQRWVISKAHLDALHATENEKRAKERARLAEVESVIPGFDAAQHLEWNQPLPPPDYTDDANRILGLPIRVADVDDILLEEID